MLKKRVLIIVLLVSASAFAQNLLVNGNFSAGGSGWSHWDANVRSEFDGSGQLATKAWAIGGTWSAGGAFQDVPGIAGQEYTLSADIAIDSVEPLPVNGGRALTKLEFYDAGGVIINGPNGTDISVIINDGTTSPIGQWIHVTGSMTAPAGTVTVRAVVMALDTGGGVSVAWFDNVSLEGPTVPVTNDPDYNDDGDVNLVDFSDLAGAWRQVSSTYNLTGEELIDIEDLEVFASAWLRTSPYPGYALVWSDEFDGSSLNLSNWSYQNGDGCPNLCGWGNNELQYYRTENTAVSGGNLVITAKAENYGGRNYTSGKIISRYKQDFLYGRIEARMKVPTGEGMWPAFWMMPTDEVYGGWAASGEIDIMETCNNTDFIGGTIHFGDNWPDNTSTGGDYSPGGVNFSDDFHVYAIEWEPDVMRWYVDDVLYSTKTNSQWYTNAAPGNPRAPFDQEFYIIINVAVGGWYTDCTEAGCITAVLPQEMLVDWVRVYQSTP